MHPKAQPNPNKKPCRLPFDKEIASTDKLSGPGVRVSKADTPKKETI
jgi:hypothetical protein